MKTQQIILSGKQLANQKAVFSRDSMGGRSKTSSQYWVSRIFKPKNDRGEESPNYSMKVSFKGRRVSFTLDVPEKEAAARRAALIYNEILRDGLDATLAARRPQKPGKPASIATVGEYIAAAEKVFSGSPRTFGGYALALRRIAGDISGTLKTKNRFRPGGKTDFRKIAEAVSLAVLTPENIQTWRLAYVTKAKNPAAQKSARTTANSVLRQARSLFGKRITKYLTALTLPDSLPFAAVEFFPRESMKYQSKIDPATLLQTAASELQTNDGAAFLALLLAIGCGLRRGEIDRLLWRQIDFKKGIIHLEITEAGGLKSADSQGDVAIDEVLTGILRGFHAKAGGESFVLPGNDPGQSSRAWGHRYRAQAIFDRLNAWLRKNGVNTRTPLHTLRKEAGSLIATAHGILAASKFLRHHDIGITAAFYADHKERVAIPMGAFLPAENVIKFSGSEAGTSKANPAVETIPCRKRTRK